MKKEVNLTQIIAFCDEPNCQEKAIKMNKPIGKDYCYKHAIEHHKHTYITKYRLRPTYQEGFFTAIKKIGCVEEDTFCPEKFDKKTFKKFKMETFSFPEMNDIAEFIFKICEQNKWLTSYGYDDYGETEFGQITSDKDIAKFEALFDKYNRKKIIK